MHGGQVQARSESVVGMVAGKEQDGDQECVEGLLYPTGLMSGKTVSPDSAVRLPAFVFWFLCLIVGP